MAIKEKEIFILITPRNMSYYKNLGYNIQKQISKNGIRILVKIKDLVDGSSVKLTKICDDCGVEVPNISYRNIIKSRTNTDGKDRCKKCNVTFRSNNRKNNVKYENSLEYYALTNNKEYLLKEFSNKNEKKLSEISYGTADKYLWNCPDCKSEYDMRIDSRITGKKCPFCRGYRVNHTNCLWTTHQYIAKLLTNTERGYEVTAGNDKKESFTCPECGNIEIKIINNVVNQGFSCSMCSDSISYSEKIVMSVLYQLNVKYERQKQFEWSNNKFYDFYISSSLNCIIETHGRQHYENTGFTIMGGRTLEEEQENDNMKEKLAKENGIKHYIVINCRYSDLEYIKNNIMNSELNNLFDLSNIDWKKCEEFACNSLVRLICKLWEDNIGSTIKIAEITNLSDATIRSYLKRGNRLGLCNYDPKEAQNEANKRKCKKIIQLSLDNQFIREWDSMKEIERKMKINIRFINLACKKINETSHGFKWMYAKEYYQQLNNIS